MLLVISSLLIHSMVDGKTFAMLGLGDIVRHTHFMIPEIVIASLVPRPSLTAFFAAVAKTLFATAAKKL